MALFPFMSIADVDLNDVSTCDISMFDTSTLSLLDVEDLTSEPALSTA